MSFMCCVWCTDKLSWDIELSEHEITKYNAARANQMLLLLLFTCPIVVQVFVQVVSCCSVVLLFSLNNVHG